MTLRLGPRLHQWTFPEAPSPSSTLSFLPLDIKRWSRQHQNNQIWNERWHSDYDLNQRRVFLFCCHTYKWLGHFVVSSPKLTIWHCNWWSTPLLFLHHIKLLRWHFFFTTRLLSHGFFRHKLGSLWEKFEDQPQLKIVEMSFVQYSWFKD